MGFLQRKRIVVDLNRSRIVGSMVTLTTLFYYESVCLERTRSYVTVFKIMDVIP